MKFDPFEPTAAHLTYLIVAGFLIVFALFSVFIRNTLHLSESPLALLTGILFGPKGFGVIDPTAWGIRNDNVIQELTRIIAGLQVFAVGLDLPRKYLSRHWKSVLFMLGPIMTFGWFVCAGLVRLTLGLEWPVCLVISACLTPTDPVLAASVISNSRFSSRVPARIKRLLAVESGCNDGVSFPFLYASIFFLTKSSWSKGARDWAVDTLLWQCCLGVVVGLVLGFASNRLLRFSDRRQLIGASAFLVFYLLLAILSIGIASTLGLDDYLVAFAAGVSFSHDGWFSKLTKESNLNTILDLVLNSGFFVYLGAVIPWDTFGSRSITPELSPGKLVALLIGIILLRRIPITLVLKPLIPDMKTWREALFCGHFGPMGVGALFLAVQARAQIENGSDVPLPNPPSGHPHEHTLHIIWPVVNFIVLGSTLIHGFSVTAISYYSHLVKRYVHRREPNGVEPLQGMQHHDSEVETPDSDEDDTPDNGWEERHRRITLA